jgi:hypothetical protein
MVLLLSALLMSALLLVHIGGPSPSELLLNAFPSTRAKAMTAIAKTATTTTRSTTTANGRRPTTTLGCWGGDDGGGDPCLQPQQTQEVLLVTTSSPQVCALVAHHHVVLRFFNCQKRLFRFFADPGVNLFFARNRFSSVAVVV